MTDRSRLHVLQPVRLHRCIVLVLAVALGACGGGSPDAGRAPLRSTALLSSAPVLPVSAEPADGDRSIPYYQPVTVLSGTGDALTEVFTIDAAAVQWRVEWTCADGDGLDIRTVPATTGVASDRAIADEATCPAEGRGFSQTDGQQSLQITAGGDWHVRISQQMTEPGIETPPEGWHEATVLAAGLLYDIDEEGRGAVSVRQLADGRRVLGLEDFYVSPNVDLELRLSPVANPGSTPDVAGVEFVGLDVLDVTAGRVFVPIDDDVELDAHRSLVIWCELTFNAYAAAPLEVVPDLGGSS